MRAFFAAALTLFLVIDALGNVPTFVSLLKPYSPKKQRQIAIRELFIALGIMFVFYYFGQILLTYLNISKETVQISGGVILFLIAIRLIFSEEEKAKWEEKEPLIVPIATPIIAGPSTLAMIMIFAKDDPTEGFFLPAIFLAWLFSSIIFFFATPIFRLIKEKGLMAAQRLMGLIVALIAVQLFLEGIKGVIQR
ncbi:MAG: MarC family protein [Chlamydiales bacterium]